MQGKGNGVNRADFIPDVIWVHRGKGSSMYPLKRADEPDVWSKLVNSGDAIVIQVDEGKLEEDGTGTFPTSSSSAPTVIDMMLGLLDVHQDMNVLEIGAGTGYNAALIAEKVTPGHVTTIEVDERIAEHARTVLARTGLPVTVVTGDGACGYAENAPYDRVMCTASVLRVPYAWVKQTRPDGKIVLPLVGSFRRGAFLCLTVDDDGTAKGRFHGGASFMRLRNQRDDEPLWMRRDWDEPQVSTTRLFPSEPFTEFEAGFAFGARLPGWVIGRRKEGNGSDLLRVSHRPSGSWASFTSETNGEHEVRQYGPRRLWDELEAAYQWWVDAGKPDHTRFGLTVTSDGQALWLDSLDQVISPFEEPTA
jgi:protein-L-isoaspartate O-methyltransferase